MNIQLSKIRFLSLGVLILAIVVFGCIREKKERADVPEWFLNIPEYPNAFVAVGSGDGRAEALCNALSELSFNIETLVSSMMGKPGAPRVYKNDTGIHFGKISVSSMSKYYMSANGLREHTSMDSKISFSDQLKHFDISVFYEETSDSGETTSRTHFEITSKNCVLEDVLDELKRLGIGIETYAGKKSYFVKLTADKANIKTKT